MGKEYTCNIGDIDSVPGLERSPGERHNDRLQYYCLVKSMVRGAWQANIHGVAKSQTQLNDGAHTHAQFKRWSFRLSYCLSGSGAEIQQVGRRRSEFVILTSLDSSSHSFFSTFAS